MRWSDGNEDNLDALRGNGDTKLGAALTELREHNTEPSNELRERIRELAAAEPESQPRRRTVFGFRPSFAHVGALAAAVLLIAVAIPIATMRGDQGSSERSDAGSSEAVVNPDARALREAQIPARPPAAPPPPPMEFAPPPPGGGGGGGGSYAAPKAKPAPLARLRRAARPRANSAAPLPSTTRAQDYSADIKVHVADHDELSDAVQSAIRTTRQLGGYVTYVDYGTSGEKDGEATVAVRVPVGRVQAAVARFSQLGTILEQQTEVVDLQSRIDKITRNIQQRRDRLAKVEAQLKDPTLSDAERNRLEARVVQAKRGLANAQRSRASVIRQSRYAKLDLAFTTEKRNEPAPPPSDLRKTLDDALGILGAELGVLLYVLIAGAPFIALGLLAFFGARAARRSSSQRVLERA
ncbi:MAG TPA: DUF4349 domain-containing protein [Gaiellaceae bacterium]|nr:DUF4349 domain-containing protein [Gaiellaceae bacterium]